MTLSVNYDDFLHSKKWKIQPVGIRASRDDIHPMLFDFQRDVVLWALRKGRCALFLDTGLGKTFCQLEWARLLGGKSLIIAPLSVARQTIKEGVKINIPVKFVSDKSQISDGINITNYELIDKFDSEINSIVLDESSILKSINSKTRIKLLNLFRNVSYKLCCSATPSPNDFIELGNHSHFLGVASRQEMLSTYFINANKEHTIIMDDFIVTRKGSNKGGQEWRLKHHAEHKFFEWLSTWAMIIDHPSNLGYAGSNYNLPPLNIIKHIVTVNNYTPDNSLFFMGLKGISDRATVRQDMAMHKIPIIKDLINANSNGQWIIWCGLDKEATAARKALEGISQEISGKDSIDCKIKAFEDFQDNKYKVLISKPKIAGMGLNFQNSSNMIFYGLNDSWETFYQAIRRQWRFGQTNPVNVHIVLAEHEIQIYDNIMRKDNQNKRLRKEMIEVMKDLELGELQGQEIDKDNYMEETIKNHYYTLMRGDSCIRLKEISDESIDLSVYSPPFTDLFCIFKQ
jgi:hypothetical protein